MIPDNALKLTNSAVLDCSGANQFVTSADWIDVGGSRQQFFGGGRPMRMLIHVLGDFEAAAGTPEFVVALVAANSADLLTAPYWVCTWGLWGSTLHGDILGVAGGYPKKNEMYEVIIPTTIAATAVATATDPNAPTQPKGPAVWGRLFLRALYFNTVAAAGNNFTATPAAGGNGAQLDIYLTHDVPRSAQIQPATLSNAT